jgi:hypothetical protein
LVYTAAPDLTDLIKTASEDARSKFDTYLASKTWDEFLQSE